VPPPMMADNAKLVTDEDVKISAEYFAALKYQPWIKVIETETVPKTHVVGFMLVPFEGAAMEPIGQRVIEVAQDVARTALRDSRAGFVAYVPVGSIKRGSGHHWWPRQNDCLCNLSWPGPERLGRCAATGRPFTDLHRAPVIRLPKRRPGRAIKSADEGERSEAEHRGYDIDFGLCSFTQSISQSGSEQLAEANQ